VQPVAIVVFSQIKHDDEHSIVVAFFSESECKPIQLL
jgi:hypothetical protein